jgi:hypothetical protein
LSGKVWKELKNDKIEYKSSLDSHPQKPIGALNSSRIGEKVELKIQNFCLERSEKVWKELKKKMSINRVWVVIDKNRLVH